MSEFVDETVQAAAKRHADIIFPLPRAELLAADLRDIFSKHLGNIQQAKHFEAEGLLVTGRSGAGKTTELADLIRRFNKSGVRLPVNESSERLPHEHKAQIVQCLLSGVGGWKDLGTRTAKALGYNIGPKTRLTQNEIWDVVVREAKLRGIVGIHFDEVQHIFRKRTEQDRLAILDAFKTLMKAHDWPLILIFSGVPELDDYIREEFQLYRLLRSVPFEDATLPEDYETIHEIMHGYASKAGIELEADLRSQDFLDRLATAGAYRWGLIIQIVTQAVTEAQKQGADHLARGHFIDSWVSKTKVAPGATPFMHRDFETLFRKDHPFLRSVSD